MATLNLKKVGNLVLVEYTGRADRIISASNPTLEFDMPGDGTGVISISLAGRSYPLTSITDLQINGLAATDQADSLTKLATVFPEANSGNGGSGLPSQTGNFGKFLKTNGSAASWGNTINNDIEITDFTKGVILTSPNATRWRITINNSGALVTTQI